MSQKIPTQEEKDKELYTSLSNLLTEIIDKYQITTKYAILIGQRRVMYIKGKELSTIFKKEENFNFIKTEIEKITKINIGKEPNEKSLQNFFEIFLEKKMLLKLKRIEGDKAKYPKHLNPPKRGENITTFEENCFYWVNIISDQSKKSFIYLLLIKLILFLACLFPIWPLNVKLGVLYFLMAVLIFMIVFLFSTIIIQILGLLIGYDILIMPNIDEAKMSWKNRLFNPFIIINSREDPCSVKIIRILLLISLTALCVLAYL
jgi:translocation protein SEC62